LSLDELDTLWNEAKLENNSEKSIE
jgi:hypothetical protein